MNIIEVVRGVLQNYDKMDDFTNGVHIDFAESDSCGLAPIGDKLVKSDILGNQERQQTFVLYADGFSINDYSRLQNSTFLLELGYYLETIKGNAIDVTINNVHYSGRLKSISTANAMMYEVPTGDINDGIRYQVQIFATYTLEGR